jgi:uncharacterized membrane protein (DUF2068 family)
MDDSLIGDPTPVNRRETKWLLKRCARHGHVLAYLADPMMTSVFTATAGNRELMRCLRCGDFVPAGPARDQGAKVVGDGAAPVGFDAVPQALRGSHGRKLGLLRLLAVERGLRGLVLLLAGAGIARLADSRVAAAQWLGQIEKSAEPLAKQVGWDLPNSPTLAKVLDLLGKSSHTFVIIAWLLGLYGVLQLVEGFGLWGGWRWAEYLAAVATAVFIPVEIYELTHHASVLKVVALLVNVAAVAYLVYKGRLFGVRGGHLAYLAEVRDGTLLAHELRAAGRAGDVLTSQRLI